MSDHAISVWTLSLTIIAAVAATIAAIPQLPILRRMVVKPKAYVHFSKHKEDGFEIWIHNSKRVAVGGFDVQITFTDADQIVVPAVFTPTNVMSTEVPQGMIAPSSFTSIRNDTVHARVDGDVDPGARIRLGSLRVTWPESGVPTAKWAIFINGKIVRAGISSI